MKWIRTKCVSLSENCNAWWVNWLKIHYWMMRIKYFTATRKMPILCFWRRCDGRWLSQIFFWLQTPPENHSDLNQICFYSKLGKVFPLAEFQAKLFLTRNWVGGFYRDSLLRGSFPRRDFTFFNFFYGLELALRLTILCVDRVFHAYASTQAWRHKLKRGKRHQNINTRRNFPSLCCAEIGVSWE